MRWLCALGLGAVLAACSFADWDGRAFLLGTLDGREMKPQSAVMYAGDGGVLLIISDKSTQCREQGAPRVAQSRSLELGIPDGGGRYVELDAHCETVVERAITEATYSLPDKYTNAAPAEISGQARLTLETGEQVDAGFVAAMCRVFAPALQSSECR